MCLPSNPTDESNDAKDWYALSSYLFQRLPRQWGFAWDWFRKFVTSFESLSRQETRMDPLVHWLYLIRCYLWVSSSCTWNWCFASGSFCLHGLNRFEVSNGNVHVNLHLHSQTFILRDIVVRILGLALVSNENGAVCFHVWRRHG